MIKFDINSVLSSGILVKTRFPNSETWITNIIESVSNDIIYLPVHEEYFKEDILNEDSIIIEFADHEKQYNLDCRIIDIDIVNSQTLSIKLLKVSVFENDRKSERYYINLGANVSSQSNQGGSTAIVTNISTSGIYFISKQSFKKNEKITIDILVKHEKILSFQGEIIRSDPCKFGYENAIKLIENEEIAKNVQELIGIVDSKVTKLRNKIHKKPSNSFIHSKVLLIEPSTLIRTMVKNVINSLGIANIFEASTSSDVEKLLRKMKPDIVFLSYIIYDMEDNQILDDLYQLNPDMKIIILSGTPKEQMSSNLLFKYKIDYISKTSSYESLYNSIVESVRNMK